LPCFDASVSATSQWIARRSKPSGDVALIERSPDAVLAGQLRPGRGERSRHRHLDVRVAVRAELEHGVAQDEPVGLDRDRLGGGLQRHDRVEALLHHAPLLVGIDAHEVRIERKLSGTAPEHQPTAREVVEHHHAVEEHERLVIRQRAHARTEADVARALRGRRDEHLG
jgi:hypothetical protein